jgi:AhpD family alkylhydroperoxidase
MTHVTVFDPAMCCSTGVCGPSVDPKIVTFAADLDWLASRGVTVVRHNLAQAPAAFLADSDAKATIETRGEEGLPLVKVDGVVRSSGVFPARSELATWAGLGEAQESLYSAAVAELVAIGAAVAANCDTCFKFHYAAARKLGVSRADMALAVRTAEGVKASKAKAMSELAERHVSPEPAKDEAAPAAAAPKASCCGPKKSCG